MKLAEIVYNIYTFPRSLRILILLMNQDYIKAENICQRNIQKGKHLGLYYNACMLTYTYQKKHLQADICLEKLLEINKVSKRVKIHYIKFLLSFLIKGKEYKRVNDRCKTLLESEDDEYICKTLLKALCQVSFNEKNYSESLLYCDKLSVFEDNETINFRNWYLDEINKLDIK